MVIDLLAAVASAAVFLLWAFVSVRLERNARTRAAAASVPLSNFRATPVAPVPAVPNIWGR